MRSDDRQGSSDSVKRTARDLVAHSSINSISSTRQPALIRAMVPKWLHNEHARPTQRLMRRRRSSHHHPITNKPCPLEHIDQGPIHAIACTKRGNPVRDLAPHAASLPGIAVCTMALIFSSMARSTHRKRPEQLTLDAVRYHSGRGGPRHGAGRPRGHTTAGHAPATRAHRRPRAGACHDPVETRHTELAPAAVRAKVPFFLERGLRPARLPGRALLDPTRSRASADRGAQQPFDRLWDEERRCAHRQAREPALPAQRQGARRSLSPASRYARRSRSIVHYVTCCSITDTTPRSGVNPSTIDHLQAQPDSASSGRWFDGWHIATAPPNPKDIREVAPARTWLLHSGWRRHGLIHPAEVP